MPNHMWEDAMFVQAFQLARTGLSNERIAKALGVSPNTFGKWIKEKPALHQSLEDGRKPPGEIARTFQNYVFKRLPPKLRKLWKKLKRCAASNQIVRMEALLENSGSLARQKLFVHAFTAYNFNVSRACRAVNISRKTVNEWVRNDPDFGELLEEMEEYKDDFIEDKFLQLIRDDNEKAIIAAAKMRLHKRGYGEKRTKDVNIKVSGGLQSKISIDDAKLPIAVRQQLLAAHRQKQEQLQLKEHVEDAEIVSVK